MVVIVYEFGRDSLVNIEAIRTRRVFASLCAGLGIRVRVKSASMLAPHSRAEPLAIAYRFALSLGDGLAQASAILSGMLREALWSDHLYSSLFEPLIKWIAVVSSVTNESFRSIGEKILFESIFNIMPLRTSRLLLHGRPRPSRLTLCRGTNGSIDSHCSSVNLSLLLIHKHMTLLMNFRYPLFMRPLLVI